MANYRQRHKAYREEKSRWDSLGKKKSDTPEPEMPPLKMFLIAGNNSGTGVLENLIEADGIGLICETEADTVSTAIGTEHGHWSDTLRKCHDHERLAFNRRTNREYRECPASYLSVLLSGTPAQVRPLIPSAENGLFSRQLFYRMPPIDEWADQFEQGDEDMDSLFSDWGKQWKMLVDYLRERVNIIQFHLSDTQKERFNSCFARIFGHAGLSYGYPMRSSVARIAINICRIASEVVFSRKFSGETRVARQPGAKWMIWNPRLPMEKPPSFCMENSSADAETPVRRSSCNRTGRRCFIRRASSGFSVRDFYCTGGSVFSIAAQGAGRRRPAPEITTV